MKRPAGVAGLFVCALTGDYLPWTLQLLNLNEPMRVAQLKLPVVA